VAYGVLIIITGFSRYNVDSFRGFVKHNVKRWQLINRLN
jgi:hypothetical protein